MLPAPYAIALAPFKGTVSTTRPVTGGKGLLWGDTEAAARSGGRPSPRKARAANAKPVVATAEATTAVPRRLHGISRRDWRAWGARLLTFDILKMRPPGHACGS
jgi:hypothetical protein